MVTEQPEERARTNDSPGAPGPPGAGPRGRRKGRFTPRRKACSFCIEGVKAIDYKDVGRLRRFLSDRARIEPRRKLGTCAKHQRALAVALKRARHLALLPYTAEQVRETGALVGRQ
jgi:small subunit ribosomal protein S18